MKIKLRYFGVILLPLFLLANAGCHDEDLDNPFFRIEVIGKGYDCGDTYLVRFHEEDEERINKFLENSNAYFPVFYAIG